MPSPLHLRLPATSANLGPGFDAVGLALALYLDVRAEAAETFTLTATGRNTGVVASLAGNLMLDTYRDLAPHAPPLRLIVHNEIPLGMGCGSSAAALVAGVLLADHFGALHMGRTAMLEEACRREGHPDNIAACLFGGLTVSAMQAQGPVTTATFGTKLPWRLLLALPASGLATTKARALLPPRYTRADAVSNVQATALLVSAFALGRSDLLAAGTSDRMHQPYRSEACPLLPRLLPLTGTPGIHAVTLSGAGPSVLLIADAAWPLADLRARIVAASDEPALELLETAIGSAAVWA